MVRNAVGCGQLRREEFGYAGIARVSFPSKRTVSLCRAHRREEFFNFTLEMIALSQQGLGQPVHMR